MKAFAAKSSSHYPSTRNCAGWKSRSILDKKNLTSFTNRRLLLQPKIKINHPQDRYDPGGVLSLKAGGQPLPGSVCHYFGHRFGYDFSKVKVHTDSRADDAAKSVNSRAFTIGRDVVFGAGQYSPGTAAGKRLLAHELTHVVQQGSNPYTNQLIQRCSGRSSRKRRRRRRRKRRKYDSDWVNRASLFPRKEDTRRGFRLKGKYHVKRLRRLGIPIRTPRVLHIRSRAVIIRKKLTKGRQCVALVDVDFGHRRRFKKRRTLRGWLRCRHLLKGKTGKRIGKIVVVFFSAGKDRRTFLSAARNTARKRNAVLRDPIEFHTGRDIIRDLKFIGRALGKISEVHIHSHSGPEGVYGARRGRGLYKSSIKHFQTNYLSHKVKFFFHGCRIAGTDVQHSDKYKSYYKILKKLVEKYSKQNIPERKKRYILRNIQYILKRIKRQLPIPKNRRITSRRRIRGLRKPLPGFAATLIKKLGKNLAKAQVFAHIKRHAASHDKNWTGFKILTLKKQRFSKRSRFNRYKRKYINPVKRRIYIRKRLYRKAAAAEYTYRNLRGTLRFNKNNLLKVLNKVRVRGGKSRLNRQIRELKQKIKKEISKMAKYYGIYESQAKKSMKTALRQLKVIERKERKNLGLRSLGPRKYIWNILVSEVKGRRRRRRHGGITAVVRIIIRLHYPPGKKLL
jgi:hypothetical protein